MDDQMVIKRVLIGISLAILSIQPLFSASKTVSVHSTENNQTILGTITFETSPYGVLIYPKLSGLQQGQHGLHLHEKANCDKKGMAAGSHYDPQHTNNHFGPYRNGHLGDLPALYVNEKGEANTPTLAPRLSMGDLRGMALIIHQGGDNYSNTPPLGGGGKRIGCGIVK